MGSIRVSPPRGAYDRREQEIHLSPRRSRAPDQGDSRTLPSISDLLPEMNVSSSKHSGAAAPHRGADRSPPYPYRYTPPTSSRPSPTNPTFTDRFAGPTRRDDYQLPLHAGPPGDRAPPNLTASGWADRRPLSTASQSSAYGPYHSSSQHTSPYSAPSGPPSGSSHRSEDYHSALPPPPPPQHARESMHEPHSYPPTRDYPYEDSRYDSPRWDEHPRPPYSSYTAPSPSAPRDNPSRTFDPHSSASAPPGHHGYPAGDGYSSHYSNLPPIHYDRDEPPRKRRGNLPRWITDLLKAWFLEHIAHPYPSEQEKNELCMQTGCSMTQISNWFINARRRRTPELTRQAEAERRLRDTAGRSSSTSE